MAMQAFDDFMKRFAGAVRSAAVMDPHSYVFQMLDVALRADLGQRFDLIAGWKSELRPASMIPDLTYQVSGQLISGREFEAVVTLHWEPVRFEPGIVEFWFTHE